MWVSKHEDARPFTRLDWLYGAHVVGDVLGADFRCARLLAVSANGELVRVMKPIYLVCRHRLAPKHYQGLARKRAVYNRDYEVIHITSDVADANAKKLSCEMQNRMAKKPEPYKYTIARKVI